MWIAFLSLAWSRFVEITSSNLDLIQKPTCFTFAHFYQPGCRFCSASLEAFQATSEEFADIHFANVNCDVLPSSCDWQVVVGLPTLYLWWKPGLLRQEFTEERTKSEMVSFLIQYTNKTVTAEFPIAILNPISIPDFIQALPNQCKLLLFHFPWSRSSREVREDFWAATKAFALDRNVFFGEISCFQWQETCVDTFGVFGPTVAFYGNESYEGLIMPGSREAIVDFVNEKCGTSRNLDGSFTDGVFEGNEGAREMLEKERQKITERGTD
jgi:hypothetical protein